MKKAAFSIPFQLFGEWYAGAKKTEPEFANAMALSTATREGRPSSRMVLLKAYDEKGFVFYTNLDSRKSLELKENPRAALLFHWKSRHRQIRIEGPIDQVTDKEADEYYATRPRGAQLGAWASDQSRVMKSRHDLKVRLAKYSLKFSKVAVERPQHWSGYRVRPDFFEFWTNRKSRLHDREAFRLDKDGVWIKEYLYP